MSISNFFNALGGFGIFLFSLRFLTTVLERSLARRFKGVLERMFSTPLRCLACGTLITTVVQASSITIIAAMGLVGTALIPLEQGYFLMLGATIGTTIKAWFFALNVEQYGPAIIGICSVALIFVRRPFFRELLEVAVAIGFTFFGLDLLAANLEPLSRLPAFLDAMQRFHATSLTQQALGVLVGMLLTMAIQSSSTVVFLTIHLATQGLIDFESGLCLVLGANVGTTITAWLASMEYDTAVRRLAVGHILVKTLGVCFFLFVFPVYLKIVSAVGAVVGSRPGELLAAAHTIFNILNVAIFTMLANLTLRMLAFIIPHERAAAGLALPAVVRRMLIRTPQRALDESARQLGVVMQQSKALVDYCLDLLDRAATGQHVRVNPTRFGRNFTDLKDSLHDLLLRLSRRDLTAAEKDVVRRQLELLGRCEGLHQQGMSLRAQLRTGVLEQHNSLPASLALMLADYRKNFDAIWLRVHFRSAPTAEEVASLLGSVDWLQDAYFEFVSTDKALTQTQMSWMYDLIDGLRKLATLTVSLSTQPSTAETVDTDSAVPMASEPPAAEAV